MDEFRTCLDSVLNDLLAQGRRVTDMCLQSVESYFSAGVELAEAVIRADATVDHVDVQSHEHEAGCRTRSSLDSDDRQSQ